VAQPNRIMITGNNGYIGSVLAPCLRRAGYDVVGLDTNYFAECQLVPELTDIPTLRRDLRDLQFEDLRGVNAVIHLGALSNDPVGNLNAAWTRQINLEGTIRLAKIAKRAGVRRFIFSSSCIMYGTSELAVADEASPLAPQTEYARSKVLAEIALRELADHEFSPTYCRNGTVYGLSSRMRFDTVLNDLIASAYTTGRVEVHSDGTPWRPVVHVEDVARAFQTVLEAPLELIHNQAFNVGAEHLNCQIRALAEIAVKAVPGCELVMLPRPGADQRTYRAGFAKFARTFPNFEFLWTPADGARELGRAFQAIKLTLADYQDKRFTRLRWLRHLLDAGLINRELRWRRGGECGLCGSEHEGQDAATAARR
jgi:nucleoside-diphosphate-sugar epimerase